MYSSYKKLSKEKIAEIQQLFVKEHDNRIERIAALTNVSYHMVRRAVDEYYKNKTIKSRTECTNIRNIDKNL